MRTTCSIFVKQISLKGPFGKIGIEYTSLKRACVKVTWLVQNLSNEQFLKMSISNSLIHKTLIKTSGTLKFEYSAHLVNVDNGFECLDFGWGRSLADLFHTIKLRQSPANRKIGNASAKKSEIRVTSALSRLELRTPFNNTSAHIPIASNDLGLDNNTKVQCHCSINLELKGNLSRIFGTQVKNCFEWIHYSRMHISK